MVKRLYLVRHPRPATEPDFCYGRTDLPADVDEVARIAALLEHALPADVPLFTSPLVRCRALALALGRFGHRMPQVDKRLAEIDFGTWEMRAWSSIPRAEIDAWACDMVHYAPGGGESILQAAQRVQAFYRTLPAYAAEEAVAICHAGTIRLLSACLVHSDPKEIAALAAQAPHAIAYGEVVVLELPLPV